MTAQLDKHLERVKTRLRLGGAPLIVVGSGLSAGIGAPTMRHIHEYLQGEIRPNGSETAKRIRALIEVLLAEPDCPRSVSVRLYHLLQTSPDEEVRQKWRAFGVYLLAGKLAKSTKPLWDLEPSAGHHWVARLGESARAIVVSLNYDGLTHKAVNSLRPGQARVLSTADEIHQFFTSAPPPSTSPIPIIKIRGDVFHAECDNGRCPDLGKSVPIYQLWKQRKAGVTEARQPPDPVESAGEYLKCPTCDQPRGLRISFPGVLGKEEEIDEALVALHQIHGSRIACVIFLGFSGKWDEPLVRYLAGRGVDLDAPLISLSNQETPAIGRAAEETGAEYFFVQYSSGAGSVDQPVDPDLASVIDPASLEEPGSEAVSSSDRGWRFPALAFRGLGLAPEKAEFSVKVKPVEPNRSEFCVKIVASDSGEDTIAGIAREALNTPELRRLEKCNQLGPKSSFICEASLAHTRYHHSASAAALAAIWHIALCNATLASRTWDRTPEARLALELATLFHDARHLPFSHMMEEIFRELNWGYLSLRGFEGLPQWVDRIAPDTGGDFGKKLSGLLTEQPRTNGSAEWWDRVVALQEGRVGIPWLEAIVDSALDVDKIQYIFHDSRLTGQNVRLADLSSWLGDFISGQSLTPEGLIRLEGEAAFAASALLEERMYLYRHLYLAPELRALEALVKAIVVTWLKWKVPDRLPALPTEWKSGTDLRPQKADTAGKLLWDMFMRLVNPAQSELHAVGEMADELKQSAFLDPAAKELVGAAWSSLKPFLAPISETPTLRVAREQYLNLAPIGPLYSHVKHESQIRRICRLVRVHLPMVALIDIAKFPKFLSTPRHRAWRRSGDAAVAEQFLVPGLNPSEWRRGRRATIPLSRCELARHEMPVIQILVVDPFGRGGGSSAFTYDMLRRQFRDAGVGTRETPEEAARLGPSN